ncbi:MAG: hypothetical protein IKT27_03700 [Clostridia bacterium]|nr:hypothetical protein [Clostridia bacterium]
MATLFEKMVELKEKRESLSNQGGPFAKTLSKTAEGMQRVANAVDRMQLAVKDQIAANAIARRTGEATDVQDTIRNLLTTKIAEDKIEQERHQRMMDLAESLVPQVTEEQLKAFRLQQLVAREHRKTLEATVELEKKKYDLQKKNAEDMQKRRIKAIETERAEANFAIKDKYGTIESAIGGLGNSGGDSLGKFLVAGLGRYVKENKETPISEATKEKYDALVNQQNRIAEGKKALADKEFGVKQADINEEFAIRAAKQGIKDPGSAASLYAERAQNVKAVAGEGVNFEKQLLSGKVKVNVPSMEKAAKEISQAIREPQSAPPAEVPTLTRSGITDNVEKATAPKAKVTKPALAPAERPEIASTLKAEIPQKASEAPRQMPKNARMQKAPRQSSRLLTPVVKRGAAPQATVNPASTGMFGSKSGAVNLGGLGKALGGVVKGIGSIAKSATKFLGPWGLVASAIMSFDRLVPIVSGLAGSIMDMTKLIMPMIVSSIIETGAQILGGINGLIELFDRSRLFGRGWYKDSEVQSKISEKSAAVEAEQEKQRKTRREVTNGPGIIDTTSVYSRGVRASVTRRETALTTPSEANAIMEQARAAQAPAPAEYQVADWRNQREQNEIMREAVMASAKNPGTTPIMVANPAMAPWTA